MARRRGLTLLEMVVAVAVLAILAGLFAGAWMSLDGRMRQDATEIRIHGINCQIRIEMGVKGYAPAKLSDLAATLNRPSWMANGEFVDGWDRPLQYSVTGKQFRVWSCGPDGVSGTADDIEVSKN